MNRAYACVCYLTKPYIDELISIENFDDAFPYLPYSNVW